MAYTSDKKPGALIQVSSLGGSDNLVVEQSGDVKRATLTQIEGKIFDAKTALANPLGTEVVVVRQTDNTLRQVALDNIVPAGKITNAEVSASAAIADTKLATISTAGKVLNSATTATSTNTNNAIVTRDGSGNFSAGTITATLAGSSTNVVDGAITNAKVASNAAIAGTKIVSNFGNQSVTGTEIISLASGGEGGQLTLQNAAGNASGALIDVDSGNVLRIYNSQNAAIGFGTNNGERMRIDASGNVFINQTSGVERLDVVGNIAARATSATGAAGFFSYINGVVRSGFSTDMAALSGAGVSYLDAQNTLILRDTNAAYAERMRIDASGNVGIGTDSPSSRLHVAGDLTLSSATTAASATAGAETLPANPEGFLVVSINGTSRKIPYYAT